MKSLVYNGKATYPSLVNTTFVPIAGKERVQLLASALNHRDLWILQDLYAHLTVGSIMGADGVGYHNGKRVIIYPGIGWGDQESHFDTTFKVLGMPDHGTFAEEIWVSPQDIFSAPAHLSDDEAAALPLVGLTAYRALMVQGKLTAGQKVLVTGIGGGVATMALQLANAAGCDVWVTSSQTSKIKQAISLGARGGFDYRDNGWAKSAGVAAGLFDVIIDGAAGAGFNDYLKLISPGGHIVLYGGTAGKIESVSPQLLFWKQAHIIGSTMGSRSDFRAMVDFVNEHHITPIVHQVYDITAFRKAFDMLRSGEQTGKIVLNHKGWR